MKISMPYSVHRCQSKQLVNSLVEVFRTTILPLVTFHIWSLAGWRRRWNNTRELCARPETCRPPGTLWRCSLPERTSDTSTRSRGSTWVCWRARGWRLRKVSERKEETDLCLTNIYVHTLEIQLAYQLAYQFVDVFFTSIPINALGEIG